MQRVKSVSLTAETVKLSLFGLLSLLATVHQETEALRRRCGTQIKPVNSDQQQTFKLWAQITKAHKAVNVSTETCFQL